MTANMSAHLANYWQLASGWARSLVNDVNNYILEHSKEPFIEDIQLDFDLFSSASDEMIEQITSYGTQEQQADALRLLTHTMSGAYQMGRLHGAVEMATKGGGGQKSLERHLREARSKLSPVSEIKLSVVKEKTAELWKMKPEFLNNIHGTATVIMEKANPEIRQRCMMLTKDERANEPLDDLKIRAMQGWVKLAAIALKQDGTVTGLYTCKVFRRHEFADL